MATHSEAPVIIWTNVHLPDGNSFNMTFRGDDPVIREEFNAEINRIAQDHDIIAYNVSYNNPFAVTAYREQAASGQPSPVEQRKLTPGGGTNWGLVKYKKSEMSFGDKYEILVSQYSFSDGKIEFWRPDAQHALAWHYLTQDFNKELFANVFGEWYPKVTGVDKVDMGDLILQIQCSGPDKQYKGKPYHNIVGKYRPGEERQPEAVEEEPEVVEEEPEETIPF